MSKTPHYFWESLDSNVQNAVDRYFHPTTISLLSIEEYWTVVRNIMKKYAETKISVIPTEEFPVWKAVTNTKITVWQYSVQYMHATPFPWITIMPFEITKVKTFLETIKDTDPRCLWAVEWDARHYPNVPWIPGDLNATVWLQRIVCCMRLFHQLLARTITAGMTADTAGIDAMITETTTEPVSKDVVTVEEAALSVNTIYRESVSERHLIRDLTRTLFNEPTTADSPLYDSINVKEYQKCFELKPPLQLVHMFQFADTYCRGVVPESMFVNRLGYSRIKLEGGEDAADKLRNLMDALSVENQLYALETIAHPQTRDWIFTRLKKIETDDASKTAVPPTLVTYARSVAFILQRIGIYSLKTYFPILESFVEKWYLGAEHRFDHTEYNSPPPTCVVDAVNALCRVITTADIMKYLGAGAMNQWLWLAFSFAFPDTFHYEFPDYPNMEWKPGQIFIKDAEKTYLVCGTPLMKAPVKVTKTWHYVDENQQPTCRVTPYLRWKYIVNEDCHAYRFITNKSRDIDLFTVCALYMRWTKYWFSEVIMISGTKMNVILKIGSNTLVKTLNYRVWIPAGQKHSLQTIEHYCKILIPEGPKVFFLKILENSYSEWVDSTYSLEKLVAYLTPPHLNWALNPAKLPTENLLVINFNETHA